MKAITLYPLWALLVRLKLKRNETRSWYTSYRGPLAIHAGRKLSTLEKELCATPPFQEALLANGVRDFSDIPTSAIVATCNLVDVLYIGSVWLQEVRSPRGLSCFGASKALRLTESELSFGDYTPGRYAWLLEDVQQIEPIPCHGRQRLWNLPEEIGEKLCST